ncbi:MAG: oligopeptide/dipeptide transporter ATPase [Streptosporangiaceae bacterium]|nr:oligopeptide/dipeptide transporter ATPase [Streptosporangiaceae bacterium]
MSTTTMTPLLSVRDLSVEFVSDGRTVQAVRGVDFDIAEGETVGVVGESGSGKSVTMNAVMRLLTGPSARITSGSVVYRGVDLMKLPEREMRTYRGKEIAMIFQDPATSFNPVQTIGWQITEAIRAHDRRISRKKAAERAIELLDLVGVPSPTVRVSQYPHEFSGGMRQRAMIAMALSNEPSLLIADEPTTALDVTVQAQILEMLQELQQKTSVAIVLITHDMGIVAETVDRVMVMYAGKLVEQSAVGPIFAEPLHPYTRGLLESLPRLDERVDDLYSIPGQPSTLDPPPPGCAFAPRCDVARGRARCTEVIPVLSLFEGGRQLEGDRQVACHFAGEVPVSVSAREASDD